MADTDPILHPDQAHAARILVQVSGEYLGRKTGLGAAAIDDFEQHRLELDPAQQEKLRDTLEELGAVLVPEDDDGGRGVRLKFTSRKVRLIDRWESEGGPPQKDTV